MYDIIIVGAGPAGLTAALYALRANKKVLVLEAKSYGGQIINTPNIENYPVEAHISGFDFANKLYNQAKDLGAEIKFQKVVDIKDNGNKKIVSTMIFVEIPGDDNMKRIFSFCLIFCLLFTVGWYRECRCRGRERHISARTTFDSK